MKLLPMLLPKINIDKIIAYEVVIVVVVEVVLVAVVVVVAGGSNSTRG